MNRSDDMQALLRQRIRNARSNGGPDAIEARGDTGPAELSFAQQRLWFLDQMVPGNPFYNIPSVLPLRMRLDIGALARALAAIVQRHEALRTSFVDSPDGPRQCIGPAYQPLGATVDLSALPSGERSRALEALATQSARAPFDLSTGPLLRASLVRLGLDDHVLVMTMHHIVSDGWSMGVLMREIIVLYGAYARGEAAPLAPLALQYADYAAWQRRMLTPDRMATLLDYWRTQLRELPTLALVTDRARPPMPTFAGAMLDLAYDLELTGALERLGRRHGATLFQVILAGFKAVLARHAGQTDIVVGAPIANRMRPELECLVGFFVNTLVLRTDLSGDPGFADLLARVRHTAIAAYEHQDLPFEKLVEELQPVRDMSRNPLAQVTFQIQNTPGAVRDKPSGLEECVRIERATAIFDMAFSLWETQNGLVGGIEFATDIFDAPTVRQLAESLECVLRAVVADDSIALSRLPLQTEAQRIATRLLLAGPVQEIPHTDLYSAFDAATCAAPDQPVLVDADGVLTRRELRQLADGLAGRLANEGVVQGDLVALVMPRGRRFVALMLATLRCGAAWLAIDPALPAARRARMLALAAPRLVLRADDDWHAGEQAAVPAPAPVRPDAAAYVLFTSGSSGQPKGVVVAHRALLNHMAWMRTALPLERAGGRVLQRTPLHFDAAVWELWAPLLGDGVLLLPPPFDAADTGRLCAECARMEASVLQIVPSLLRVLLDDPAIGRCAGLRRLCIGGEALDAALLDKVRQRWPLAEVVNLYGPTETTIDATWWLAGAALAADAPVPIGHPIANMQASILDPAGTPLPTGVIGELHLSGAGVANGYLGAGAEDAARFVRGPDGRPGYLTGDLAWARHDGLLFAAGRRDLQVKLRGVRLELGDVEAALASHPFVQGAAVLLAGGGHAGQELIAFVTVDPSATRINGADLAALGHDHVDEWRTLYQQVYEPGGTLAADAGFDTVGWTSSYDGKRIAASAMREWLAATVARLAILRPRRVLEIGCGAGLIARALAPRCQRYVACDFSEGALARAHAALHEGDRAHVRFVRCAAHELAEIGERGFDTVILNSVVQYFPGAGYLLDTLRQATALLAPGGRLFIGDVRHYGLMEAFHADVQHARGADDSDADGLSARLRSAIAQDKELLLSPGWFWQLPATLPELGRIAVRLKRGIQNSEMLAFRYDVLIEHGKPASAPSLAWHDWRRAGYTLSELRRQLDSAVAPFGLSGIPNGRVARALALQARLEAGSDADAGDTAQGAPRAVDPDMLAQAAETCGWTAELIPAPDHPGEFAAVLHRGTLSMFEADAALLAQHAPAGGRLASNPLLATIGPALEQALKQHLGELLPAALVPVQIEPLAQFALLANGKIDRAALAPLAQRRVSARRDIAETEGALERLLADIWAGVLRLRQVGAADHLFNDLGGHSLLATQIVGRVREALEVEVPLRLLFEHPTVRSFAQALHDTHGPGAELELVAGLVLEVNALDEAALDSMLTTEGEHHG